MTVKVKQSATKPTKIDRTLFATQINEIIWKLSGKGKQTEVSPSVIKAIRELLRIEREAVNDDK